MLHYIGTQPSPSLRRSVHTQSCIRMHTHTCMHSSMHACVHMRTYMHACIGALHRNPRRPREGRAPHMHGVRGGWLTRRLARCVERCPLHVCTHVYGCSVRGALPPACMYARVWMLSAWSAAPCMCVRMHMDAQCVAYTAHADRHRKDHRRLPVEVVSTWVAQIASAVSYMHSLRMLHRDLSTHNVFFTASGRVKVGDFGLTKVGGRMRAISARAYPRPRPRPHPTPQPHLQPSVPPP